MLLVFTRKVSVVFSNGRNYSRRIDNVLKGSIILPERSIILLEHVAIFQRLLSVDSVVMTRFDFEPALQVRRGSRVVYDLLECSELF